MSPILEIKHADIGFPNKIILPNFSWVVNRGDKFIITGHNGCGKTTLIRTILSLIKPQKGSIDFYDSNGEKTQNINMGYLPQVNHIDKAFPISVAQVVDSALPYRGLSKNLRQNKIQYMLEHVGLYDYKNESINRLSGGQLQRLLLARSLATEPEILILDEPMSFLDKNYKDKFHNIVQQFIKPNTAVLMVTHEISQDFNEWQTLAL